MDPPPSLFTSPWEVLLSIFCHAGTLDIVHLRLVCRLFNDVCASRALWVRRMRQLAAQELMQPLHNLHDIDALDTRALELEVTRPFRFPRALRRLDTAPPSRVKGLGEMQIVTAHLIPGGRWLLTGGQRPSEMDGPNIVKRGYINVYDLDATIDNDEELVLVAQVVLNKWVQDMVIQSALDGNSVTIATCSGTPATRFDLDVIVLTWPSARDEPPNLRTVARFANIPRKPRRLTLEDDTVAFDTGFAIAFWLWQTDQIMSGHIFDNNAPRAIILRPPQVLIPLADSGKFDTYLIPPHGKRAQLKATSSSPGSPSMFKCGLVNGWKPFAYRETCYVVAGALDRQRDESEIQLYGYDAPPLCDSDADSVVDANSTANPSNQKDNRKTITRYSIPDTASLAELALHRAGDAFVAIGAPERGSLTCNVRVTSDTGETVAKKLRLGDEVGVWRPGNSLLMCPFRGRVCVIGGGMVSVVDLVE